MFIIIINTIGATVRVFVRIKDNSKVVGRFGPNFAILKTIKFLSIQ